MASFRDYITTEGERMLAKAVAGANVSFTKVALGSGYLPAGETEKDRTELVEPKNEVPVRNVSINSTNTVLISAYFSNAGLTEGFYLREKGIYMSDGEEEVLAIYGNMDSKADFIDVSDNCVVEKLLRSVLELSSQEMAHINIVNGTHVYLPVIHAEEDTIEEFIKNNVLVPSIQIGQQVLTHKNILYMYEGNSPTNPNCYVRISDIGVTLSDVYQAKLSNGDAQGGIGASQNAVYNVFRYVNGHEDKRVYGEDWVHGMRYYEGRLQIMDDDGNIVDSETKGTGIAPDNATDISIKEGNSKLTIFWTDPSDVTVSGQTICSWAGTKLVMKVGSYPQNVKDGTLLVDSQVRDAYKDNGFTVSGLTNGTTYYFALFPYSTTNAVNTNDANRISGAPKPYRIMTVKVDLTNNNPDTCCTYADDAVGMTAGSSEWDDFFCHYPVLFKDGAEVGKLNPDNFAQFEDGTAADITSGNAGDVMIAYPRRGLTISISGTTLEISMTDDPDNVDFEYNAHTRGSIAKDVFYLGAYKGCVVSSKLRSLSGKTITANQTIRTFRTQAHANGDGYEQSGFYQLTFRQCMYILKYKNLNSQTTVGYGCVSGSGAIATGGTETWGMDCELIKATNPSYMTDQKHHVKCFGLEDFWGNIWEWIDGCVTNSKRNILTGNDNFNDSGSGYTDNGQGATANIGNYMSKPQGTTKTGFLAKEVNGSGTTYFCDATHLYASCVAYFGGPWDNDAEAGAFRLDVNNISSNSSAGIAARLMYL